ncbi:MAG: hypothetical protein RL026_884 [Pseudomonadota bacterium]|jgi:hypothetical protein
MNTERPHSGLGIASFVLSLCTAFLTLVLFGVAGAIENATPGGMDENSPVAMFIGLALFAFLGLSLLALGLGIGGAVQAGRNPALAIAGAVIGGVTFLGASALTLIGLAIDAG